MESFRKKVAGIFNKDGKRISRKLILKDTAYNQKVYRVYNNNIKYISIWFSNHTIICMGKDGTIFKI